MRETIMPLRSTPSRVASRPLLALLLVLLAGVAEGFGLSMLLPLLGLTIAGTGAAAGVALPAPSALERFITAFFQTLGLPQTTGALLGFFVK